MSDNLYVNLSVLKAYLDRYPYATATDLYADAEDRASALYLSWSADDIETAADLRPGSVPIVLHDKIMTVFDGSSGCYMGQLSKQLSNITQQVLEAHGVDFDSLSNEYDYHEDDNEDNK